MSNRLGGQMSVLSFLPSNVPASPDEQLAEFNLSVELLHQVFRPGLSRALMRTQLAPSGAPQFDLYLDGSEQLRLNLSRLGWSTIRVDGQERTVAPDGSIAIVIASADRVGILGSPHLKPITRQPKGPATQKALIHPTGSHAQEILNLGEEFDIAEPNSNLAAAPLWMLLHELTPQGLNLELSQPRGSRKDGRIDQWGPRIVVPAISISDDFEPFDTGEDDSFDIPVIAR